MAATSKRIGAAILLFSTAACTSLQPVANPDAFLARNHPAFVVVTTTEHSQQEDAMVFRGPTIEGGNLSGLVYNEATSVPVTQVRTILAKQFDKKKTTYAAVIGGVVVGGLGFLMSQHGNGDASNYFDPSCGHSPQCYKPMGTVVLRPALSLHW
jgi:hypothetical protein